jgi:hypothetical protein
MSGIGALANAVRMQSLLAGGSRADDRDAEVTSYDPVRYAVKVRLMPEGHETGWCQIESMGVGAGCGLLIGPTIGQACKVAPIGGSKDNWKVTGFCFNDVETPPNGSDGGSEPVQSGEMLLQDSSGTLIRLSPSPGQMTLASEQNTVQTVGGSLTVTARAGITITASGGKASVTDGESTIALNGDGTVSMTVPGKITITAPNAEFTGNVSVDQTLSFGSMSGQH